jgi:hypothetical protein
MFSASFNLLPPGTYAVTLAAPTGVTGFTTSPALPGSLAVVAGESVVASFTLTAVN